MKICCSSGAAKITYIIPSEKGLKYRLKGETKWNFVGGSNLTTECVDKSGKTLQWICAQLDLPTNQPILPGQTFEYTHPKPFRVTGLRGYPANPFVFDCLSSDNEYFTIGTFCNSIFATIVSYSFVGSEIKKQFSVKNVNNEVIVNHDNLLQCPDVQQAGCVFDPKNEQTITVELAFFDAPILRNIPGFPNALPTILRNCVEVVTKDNAIQIRKVGEIGYYVGENLVWIPTRLFSVVKQVDSPQGCPPPKVKIECKGDPTDRSKKCPPETDCQLECNGFLCCYSKGKLIQSIKL